MAKDNARAAPAKGAPVNLTAGLTAQDVLSDLEGGLHDAVNMAELASEYVDRLQKCRAKTESTELFILTEDHMRLLAFAVVNTLNVVDKLMDEWNGLHARMVAEKGGAA